MRKPSITERKALGTFLASRRARLKPEELGFPTGSRRTPGLRREEVAVLAGVSVSWYTWLEQGRDIQPSSETLSRVARVLRLDRVEVDHLFALSSRERRTLDIPGPLSTALVALVDAIDPIAAYVRNTRLDILAWNAAAARLFVDYGSLEPRHRNTLYLLFLHEPYRRMIVERERLAREMLATFRASRAKARDKAPFDELARELAAASREFREWWSDVDVRAFDEGVKRVDHPVFGRLDFTYVALASEKQPDLSVTAYIPKPTVEDRGSGDADSHAAADDGDRRS